MYSPCLCCKQICSQLSSSEDHCGCARPKTTTHMLLTLGPKQLPVHGLLLQSRVTMLADPYLIIQVCKKAQLFNLFIDPQKAGPQIWLAASYTAHCWPQHKLHECCAMKQQWIQHKLHECCVMKQQWIQHKLHECCTMQQQWSSPVKDRTRRDQAECFASKREAAYYQVLPA